MPIGIFTLPCGRCYETSPEQYVRILTNLQWAPINHSWSNALGTVHGKPTISSAFMDQRSIKYHERSEVCNAAVLFGPKLSWWPSWRMQGQPNACHCSFLDRVCAVVIRHIRFRVSGSETVHVHFLTFRSITELACQYTHVIVECNFRDTVGIRPSFLCCLPVLHSF